VKLYPGYHAQRDPMPPELAAQWEKAPALLESLGWTVGTSDELEADDVMFSFALAEVAGRESRNASALLLTGDRDMFQAVNDRVAVATPGKGGDAPTEIGPAQVRERYGIDPALVTDFIALRGDPSDGLPGAPGIGAKTAAELLRRHGSLEGVLLAAGAGTGTGAEMAAGKTAGATRRSTGGDMRPRIATALREHADLLRAFKQIATLVPIDGIARPPDRATDYMGGALAARELGMKQLATRLEWMAEMPG
jgi:DNA polymerase-1